MQKFDHWSLPDNERHLQSWMTKKQQSRHGRLCYQAHKYDAAMRYCKKRDVAIDVGAHVGLWSWLMVHDFSMVHAFEPMETHRECFNQNIPHKNIVLYDCALGKECGFVSVATRSPHSSGDTGVVGDGDIRMIPLDSLNLCPDFMKIDCEGYEANVLMGARDTLLRSKPVVLVEQKGGMCEQYGFKRLSACKYLESLGAVNVAEMSGDYIFIWE